MCNRFVLVCSVALVFLCSADHAAVLPNGWGITPAGRTVMLAGDMPAAMMLTPDEKNLVVTTAGYHDHTINLLNLKSGKVVQTVEVGKMWFGLAYDRRTNQFLAPAGGKVDPAFIRGEKPEVRAISAEQIHCFGYRAGGLVSALPLSVYGPTDQYRWTSGIACDASGAVYVANTNNATVYKLVDGNVVAKAAVGNSPFACSLSPDGSVLAVTNWSDETVSLINPARMHEIARIVVGSHPCAVVWSGLQSGALRLFVANSGSNSVSVIEGSVGRGWKVSGIINTALTNGALVGSTPIALAASHDGRRLYIANADNNDVAVVDISDWTESRVLGFIPTGWYPSCVAVSPDDRTLYIGVGKGLSSRANWPPQGGSHQTHATGVDRYDYVGNCLAGGISLVKLPNAEMLASYTRQVLANVPHPPASNAASRVIFASFSRIKHVVYIIRENRTYDEVFGDIKSGNGDANLVLFGSNVTPNAHMLAEKTVLFDNLYVNGEVSEDGHEWCNAAYATDFTEKAWENTYSGRGEPFNDERLYESPGGYLWDNCARHNVTYRSYGEFADFTASPNSSPVFSGEGTLAGHASAAWSLLPGWTGQRDQGRAQTFIDELHSAEATGVWPDFMVMHLFEDHTEGLTAGAYSPTAEVADNDQALGKIVDAVSHSKFWSSTAIFVIEDDAQDGPDHVDCHRTYGLVLSPYVKHGFVDHTHYTTASFVRTMEQILHLPPMSQYDKYATPLTNSFASAPVMEAFDDIPPKVDLEAKNPATGSGATASAKLDFSDVDRCDPQTLNHILWEALRPGMPMPAPVFSAESGPIGTFTCSIR